MLFTSKEPQNIARKLIRWRSLYLLKPWGEFYVKCIWKHHLALRGGEGRVKSTLKDKFINNRWSLSCFPKKEDPVNCRALLVPSWVCEESGHRWNSLDHRGEADLPVESSSSVLAHALFSVSSVGRLNVDLKNILTSTSVIWWNRSFLPSSSQRIPILTIIWGWQCLCGSPGVQWRSSSTPLEKKYSRLNEMETAIETIKNRLIKQNNWWSLREVIWNYSVRGEQRKKNESKENLYEL